MPDPELWKGAAPVKKSRPRKRDYVFDGLRGAVGIDVVSTIERGMLNKAAEVLVAKGLQRDDPVSMTKILFKAKRFRAHPRLRGLDLSAMNLVTHWDMLAVVEKTIQPGQPSRKEQAEQDARWVRHCTAAYKWWANVPEKRRLELISRHPPSARGGEIALAEFDRANRPGFEEQH